MCMHEQLCFSPSTYQSAIPVPVKVNLGAAVQIPIVLYHTSALFPVPGRQESGIYAWYKISQTSHSTQTSAGANFKGGLTE